MITRPLTLSLDISYGWLTCVEFGFVDDGIPSECYQEIAEDRVALVRHPEDGRVVGFSAIEWLAFEPAAHAELFAREHLFTVPQLGLFDATVGEICLAVKAWLPCEPTLGRAYFHEALGTQNPSNALPVWLLCLEAGELNAHYSLGYTYYELGEFHRSYRHLRTYTDLAPWNGWAWCWRGKAAAALGEHRDARRAFRRAIEIEESGGHETDAGELLDELKRVS
jgi:tetratricopeptide (TPR) repeat protein